jgi:hypothetical protein
MIRMDIGSIFLFLAILIPVALYISRPFTERKGGSTSQAGQELSTLMAERDQLVAAVKELDDDFSLGKIPAEVYPTQRQSLLQRGVEILRQIDARQSPASSTRVEDRLEAVIVNTPRATTESAGAVGRKNGNAVPPVPDDDLEQRIASRRRLKEGKAGGFCPKCGRPVQATDRFCPKCGAGLY